VKIRPKVRAYFISVLLPSLASAAFQLKRQALLSIRHVGGNDLRLVLIVLLVNDHFIFDAVWNPNGKFAPGVCVGVIVEFFSPLRRIFT